MPFNPEINMTPQEYTLTYEANTVAAVENSIDGTI